MTGEEPVRIEVTVEQDLETLHGTMWLPRDLPLVDALALLPEPADDLQRFRTFPGPRSRGRVTWQRRADGRVDFETRLPRRYGALGATRHGLFAAGGWHPVPLEGGPLEGGPLEGDQGSLPELLWEVTVHLPEGAGGAVGDTVGAEVLRWTGRGERVGLAVVDKPRFTPLQAGASDVLLLTRGRPRRALARHLGEQLALMPMALQGAVVQAPLRRRLTAHAPGLAFVSDRAYRLTPGLQFAHHPAVARGVAAALVPLPDPADRELAAAALSVTHRRRLRSLDTDRTLGLFRWVPTINNLLSSQRMPFYSEILGRAWPSDPVRDDLNELLDPFAPGTAVLAQLDDTFGEGTGQRVGEGLLLGEDRAWALQRAGVPGDFLLPWRQAIPAQDYVLREIDGAVQIERQAPEHAPPETLVAKIDGARRPLSLRPGEPLVLAPVRSVLLDPEQHVQQRSRVGDSWPARYDWTAASAIDSVNLSQGQLFAIGWLTLRRRYDTHNLFLGSLSNSRSDLVSIDLGYLRKEGRLLDGWTRPHRVQGNVSLSLLNPRFAQTDGLQVALDGSLLWAYDDRVSYDFPLSGKRIALALGGGGIPETATTWISGSALALGLWSPHPRWVLAGRSSAALARSALPHRLLTLGGEGTLRSIPTLPACEGAPSSSEAPCFPVATERLHGAFELRWAALRGLSVPMLLVWGTELQLSLGLEALAARVDGEPALASGLTAGVLGLGDVLGADSSGIGVTMGWPLAWVGLPLQRTAVPEIYLRFSQAF